MINKYKNNLNLVGIDLTFNIIKSKHSLILFSTFDEFLFINDMAGCIIINEKYYESYEFAIT